MYAIRIHQEFAVLDFLQNLSCFVVLERDATRAHYQGIVAWSKTTQALRAMVKKNCPEAVGNSGYSVKVLKETPERYIQYLCKGTSTTKPDIVINTMGVQDVESLWVQYWLENRELKKKVPEKKSTIEKIKSQFPWTECTCANVTKSVLDYLIEQNKPINPNYIQGLVLLILAKENLNYRRDLCASLIRKNNLLL